MFSNKQTFSDCLRRNWSVSWADTFRPIHNLGKIVVAHSFSMTSSNIVAFVTVDN